RLPRALYPDRPNSRGIDLSSETVLAGLSSALAESAQHAWAAAPLIPGLQASRKPIAVRNPADHRDVVGMVENALARDAQLAARNAAAAFPGWAATPVEQRAACLDRAADLLEARMEQLLGLIMREAGKSAANAIAEVREAVDFLRYYAQQARSALAGTEPVGPMVCISPWNFPLAIFTGQIAAALVAGNSVLAKPAEETPLIAAQAVAILHEAGVPVDVLQLVPGAGEIGAALVAAPETCGVIFTGSTEVAKLIQRQLATRLLPDGSPIPLIAETGGQNAMVVDSSALPEQVVRDVVASAFDSAGQRCSALRVLCVQEDIADDLLAMLRGALAELRVGPTDRLCVDVGPVISEEARSGIALHIERMRAAGHAVEQLELDQDCAHGTFVPPTIIAIDDIGQLGREVFGPVLHVLRYARDDLPDVMRQIAQTGYGLTFGLHSRIDETISAVTGMASAGNIYINRNIIGAIVGVQPFGGRGLSGTGPKAGGPLYLGRLVRSAAPDAARTLGEAIELPGPVGERNRYSLHPRGRILVLPETGEGLRQQLAAVAATGNTAVIPASARSLGAGLDPAALVRAEWTADWAGEAGIAQVLVEEGLQDLAHTLIAIAAREGPIPIVQLGGPGRPYRTDWMVEEVAVSIDTTAAGGNASLMAVA
ncbi:MAG TPA: L-glutamate gamma-semialdehyde dehydrogenase, partial [Erythrobacter sp.]|nr:L-glutamate gamma-semialdehyde dehydrogenase [Erythrobacter sp.]